VSIEDLASVEREWEQLAAESQAAPWLWPGWFAAWRAAFAPGDELLAACARDDGRLRAIGVFRRRGRRLESAANVHTPWWGIVAADEDAREAVAAAALTAAAGRVALRQVREDWADAAALRAALGRGGRILRSVREQAPFVSVTTEWESYYRGQIDRHRRREIDRCRRRLADEGPLQYEWRSPSPDDVDALLEEGYRVEASGWKGRAGTAILSHPATALFYRELARWAAARGWLRLAFLRVGRRPVAFELAFEQEATVSLVKGGYDEAAARYGPGVVLLHDLLEDAFGRGVREIDLLGGAERYKLRWAHGTRARSTVTAYRGTAGYAVARAALGIRRRLRRR
jgi:CelD/BcsL family acetyltransferase involved in cellulose biosynthesis